jgi:hypothetical protein
VRLLSFVLMCNSEPPNLHAGKIRADFREAWRSRMRVCPNTECVAFGRIVFSVATRCPLCRWDLKSALPASEAAPPKTDRHPPSAR